MGWIGEHANSVGNEYAKLSRVLDVYTQRLVEGANFRSSLLKKDPLLQYVATNLHIQVCIPVEAKERASHSQDETTVKTKL